jgi:hypothetical protein
MKRQPPHRRKINKTIPIKSTSKDNIHIATASYTATYPEGSRLKEFTRETPNKIARAGTTQINAFCERLITMTFRPQL